MVDAELYRTNNNRQRESVIKLLNTEFPYSKLKPIPNQRVLDIGCGPGDTTHSVLLPYLPADSQLVGVDISTEMIKYAKEKFGSNPHVEFREYDLECTDANVTNKLGKFDKIFSFWALHWIHDQRTALKNVHDLLKPGGEILFHFAGTYPKFGVYKVLADLPRWREHLEDAKKLIPPFPFVPDPCSEVSRLAEKIGFKNIQCTFKNTSFEYPSLSALWKSFFAYDPFLGKIPNELKESFLSELKEECLKSLTKSSENEGAYVMSYKTVTLYASKL